MFSYMLMTGNFVLEIFGGHWGAAEQKTVIS